MLQNLQMYNVFVFYGSNHQPQHLPLEAAELGSTEKVCRITSGEKGVRFESNTFCIVVLSTREAIKHCRSALLVCKTALLSISQQPYSCREKQMFMSRKCRSNDLNKSVNETTNNCALC